jgi:hypothetical protein
LKLALVPHKNFGSGIKAKQPRKNRSRAKSEHAPNWAAYQHLSLAGNGERIKILLVFDFEKKSRQCRIEIKREVLLI